MEIHSNEGSELHLDVKSLLERQTTSSSLTDKYGIPIFTDQYEEISAIKKEEKKEEVQKIQENIFVTEIISNKNSEQELQSFLFTELSNETIINASEKEQSNVTTYQAIEIFLAMGLIIAIVFGFYHIQRKRRKKAYDGNHPNTEKKRYKNRYSNG